MAASTAYLLVFHGSPDPRPQTAAAALAQLFEQRIRFISDGRDMGRVPLASTGRSLVKPFGQIVPEEERLFAPIARSAPFVGTASLECAPLPLHQQIIQFVQTQQLNTQASLKLQILPLFLLLGMHVAEDIPAEIELAQKELGDGVEISVAPHLGSHPRLRRILTEQMAPIPAEAWILLAHGSRRPGANAAIEALAEHLGAAAAYWSVPPDLESCVESLQQAGLRKIGILPFFLFSGVLTDTIAQSVQLLSQRFPSLTLHLAQPLDASPGLADLLVDLAQTQSFK